MSRLVPVPSWRLPDFWTRVQPYVELAVELWEGRYTRADIIKLLAKSHWQLWLAVDDGDDEHAIILGAAITHIRVYEGGGIRDCEIIEGAAAEHRTEWLAHLPQIEQWAKAEGCNTVRIFGRPGWEKVTKPLGYRRKMIMMEKPL